MHDVRRVVSRRVVCKLQNLMEGLFASVVSDPLLQGDSVSSLWPINP